MTVPQPSLANLERRTIDNGTHNNTTTPSPVHSSRPIGLVLQICEAFVELTRCEEHFQPW